MSRSIPPGTNNSPVHHYFDYTASPYELEWTGLHREAMPILVEVSNIGQRSHAPRQKSVHFASRDIDEFNDLKIQSSDKRHKNHTTSLNVMKSSGRKKIPSSSELFKAASSCYDPSSTQNQAFNRRTIRDQPIDRGYRMELKARNHDSIQNHQFKLIAASTEPQYPPRVPSPPMKRDPPPTPRPARLPTPDFEENCDGRLHFCNCLGCYEGRKPQRVVGSERQEASAYLKMENQCKMTVKTKPIATDLGRSSSHCLHTQCETNRKPAKTEFYCCINGRFLCKQSNTVRIPSKRCHHSFGSVWIRLWKGKCLNHMS